MHELDRDALRDRLPDLLHGHLSAADASVLEQQVASDPELARELALLRRVRAAARATPTVDIASIVRALPPAPGGAAQGIDELAARRAAKRTLFTPRFARAAAVLAVLGGGALFALRSRGTAEAVGGTAVVAVESLDTGAGALQLGLGESTDDLSMDQLRALEADIRSLDGMPSEDLDADDDLTVGEGA